MSLPEQFERLLRGELLAIPLRGGEVVHAAIPAPVLLPGAFNPLHIGHRRMAEIAERAVGDPVAYEISAYNVDKTPLGVDEMLARMAQFDDACVVWLTTADTFVKKARVFPNTTFVVGADTMRRVAQVTYYAGDIARRDGAIDEISRHGCRFLVFGRVANGEFHNFDDLALPHELRQLCTAVPEGSFRVDISSTQLRKRRENDRP